MLNKRFKKEQKVDEECQNCKPLRRDRTNPQYKPQCVECAIKGKYEIIKRQN